MEINRSEVMTVTYTLTLTEDEARQALSDPSNLKAELRLALADLDVPAIRPHRKGRRVKPQAGKVARAGEVAMATCPECGKQMKARGMGVHVSRAHPEKFRQGAAVDAAA